MRLSVYVLIALTFNLGGCYENPQNAVMHKPGVYKGAADDLPLLAERQAKLIERLQAVQTDR